MPYRSGKASVVFPDFVSATINFNFFISIPVSGTLSSNFSVLNADGNNKIDKKQAIQAAPSPLKFKTKQDPVHTNFDDAGGVFLLIIISVSVYAVSKRLFVFRH